MECYILLQHVPVDIVYGVHYYSAMIICKKWLPIRHVNMVKLLVVYIKVSLQITRFIYFILD